MKTYIILITLFFLHISGIKTQNILDPFSFFGFQPSWSHNLIDTSEINNPKNNGISHLSNINIKVKESDSIFYLISCIVESKFQGAYIEKMNLNTGHVIWSNYYSLKNNARREFPRKAYLDDEGNLIILNYRNTDPNFTILWVKGSIAVRKYDKNTGALLKYINPIEQIQDSTILDFVTYINNDLTWDGEDYHSLSNRLIPGTHNLAYTYKEFNNECKFISEHMDSINAVYPYQNGFSYFFTLFDGTTAQKIHTSQQRGNTTLQQDSMNLYSFKVNFFNNQLNIVNTIDLTDNFPYNWKIDILGSNQNLIWFNCIDSVNSDGSLTPSSSHAVVFFDYNGDVVESINFGDERFEQLFAFKTEKNDPAIIITQTADTLENHLDFISTFKIWKSDGNGNIELYKSFYFHDWRLFRFWSGEMIGDKFLLTYIVKEFEEGSPLPTNQLKGLMAIDINELLTDSKQVDVENFAINIYPNPSNNLIHIDTDTRYDVCRIFDSSGHIIQEINEPNNTVNIGNLPSGHYILSFFQDERQLASKKFVKVE